MMLETWHLILGLMIAAIMAAILIRKLISRRQLEEIRRAIQPLAPSRQQQLNQLDYLRKRGMVDAEEYARNRHAILKSKAR